ncbi:MAG: thrombospondin type 3 repeat-containing protein [Fibrobacter sp.]|nr:thrombospondin type 3 repeat-containing protein [Fibrobacter sp.]
MKIFPIVLLFSAAIAFAQVGLVQSTHGIRVPSAKTIDKGMLYFSGSFTMISDGAPLSIGGFYIDHKGILQELSENSPSNDEALFVSFAPLDNIEFGVGIPTHYDGKASAEPLNGFALGDIELRAKWYINTYEKLFFGVSGAIFLPTGSEERGFRPRHSWYINSDKEAYAYTARYLSYNVNLHLSLELNDYLTFNGYIGALKVYNNSKNFILWGGGVEFQPIQSLTIIAEVSGETPFRVDHVGQNIMKNPLRLTPALRLNLPNYTFLTISGDVGLNYFLDYDKRKGRYITLKSGKHDLFFNTAGTPNVSVGVSVSKMIDFSWSDSDGDGVIDRKDLCPNTAQGMAVNSRGCPVDEDQDGVLNIVDLCLGTMRGLEVDYNGCPLDLDKDGVYDYQDNCLKTPLGVAVDEYGCTLDSDNDGIDDNHDLCPGSKPGEPVNEEGCPLDEDHDGIPNDKDQCPATPEGFSIDESGCPLDFDHDGVPNELDRCPESEPNEKVNVWGCPADSDNDGVPDSKDQCADTPEGVKVDEAGCRLDQDKDGVFDEEDKCPDTPEEAPIDEFGCPIDSDGDGIDDWMDQCPNSLPTVKTDSVGCPINSRYNFNDIAIRIRFRDKDSTLLNSSYTALNDIVAFMREYPIAIKIQSIVDDDFDDTDKIAKGRMKNILRYIRDKGIDKSRIIIQEELERTQDTDRKGKTGVIGLTPFLIQKD